MSGVLTIGRWKLLTVSVVIPSYNRGKYLREAVNSALSQTYRDVQVVVVDDGSTDPCTMAVLNDLSSMDRVRVVRQGNRGVSAARNNGISRTDGEFIMCLDDDDLVAPEYLQRAVNVLQADLSVTVVDCLTRFIGKRNDSWSLPDASPTALALGNCVVSSAVFRRVAWERVGGFTEELKRYEDYDFWIKIAKTNGQFARVQEELFFYRVGHNSITRSDNAHDRIRRDSWLHRVFELNADFFSTYVIEILDDRMQLQKQVKRWEYRYSFIDRSLKRVRDLFTGFGASFGL